MDTPDVSVMHHGSLVMIKPMTTAAKDWCARHLPTDCPTWGDAYAVETRFVEAILIGMEEDGLLLG